MKKVVLFVWILFLVTQVLLVDADARRRGTCLVQKLQAKIKSLETQLQEKERTLLSLQSQLLNKFREKQLYEEKAIAEKEAQVKELQSQLKEKNLTITEKDLTIAKLTTTVDEMREQLSTMHLTIKQLLADIQNLNEQLRTQRELVEKLQRRMTLTVDVAQFLGLTLISSVVAFRVFK